MLLSKNVRVIRAGGAGEAGGIDPGKVEGGRCFHPTPASQSTFGSRSHLTCTPCTPKLFYHYQHLYRYNFQYWHAIMYLDSASSPIGCHFARWRFSVQKIFSKIGNMADAEIKHKSTIRNCMQTTWIDVLSLHMIRIEKTNETKKRSCLGTIWGPFLSSLAPKHETLFCSIYYL